MEESTTVESSNGIESGEPPRFVLIMGGVGVGKTTMRRQQFADHYVHLDATELFAALTGGTYCDFPGEYQDELQLLGSRIAKKAFTERSNIVMEILGNSPGMIESLNAAVRSIGYSVEMKLLTCDAEESLRRHRHACETDVNYVSAYFTQEFHQKWVLDAVRELQN
jgi:hypothetical protein